MAKARKAKAKPPDPKPLAELVAELVTAVQAATTPAQFNAAREAIRRTFAPHQCDNIEPDLYLICERKRKELGLEL
jgi:hypothetical protein